MEDNSGTYLEDFFNLLEFLPSRFKRELELVSCHLRLFCKIFLIERIPIVKRCR
jgi:hypothetical protein